MGQTSVFERLSPWIFVALWSTGFVVARYSTDNADPLLFLAVRMVLAAGLLLIFATVTNAPRMPRELVVPSALVGLFMHAVYLGGVFVAISRGLPSGLGALIAGIHPVVTSVAGRVLLGEKLRRSQWLGVVLGVVGVVVVVADKLRVGSNDVTTFALVAMVCSVIGMSTGTLIQRAKARSMPLVRGTAVQYLSSGIVLGIATAIFEDGRFELNLEMSLALAWSVLVLSLAAVLLMMLLISRHSAARVSSLFFLTPALSALEAAVLFSERLSGLAIVALIVALAGVWLTMRTPTAPAAAVES